MARNSRRPVLVIHGGAGSKIASSERLARLRESVRDILRGVYPRLLTGASALSAVCEAVEKLEDDPLFNAGRGSKIQSDGRIRMSAAIMDGDARRFSGCVNVEGVRNPIRLARLLQSEKDRVLAEAGARAYARRHRLAFRSPVTKERRSDFLKRKKGKTGTVGAIALDSQGRLAAATSTGGKGFEIPHRVSDSPTPAGCFANHSAAISATGVGEQILEFSVASALATLVEAGISLPSASTRLLRLATKSRAEFGFIAVDGNGQVTAGKTVSSLIWGKASAGEILIGF